MSQNGKPELTDLRARELMAEVVAEDRDRARQAIASGVRKAQDNWIEAPLIAEALALELISFAQQEPSAKQIAARLRGLAQAIEGQSELH